MVYGVGCRVNSVGFVISGLFHFPLVILRFRVLESRFRVQDLGFRVDG
jgi:hypothetical protein